MTTKCVEPGEAVNGPHQYVVAVPPNDELLFPHVDSCIAIAFIMNDASYIGGHVGMQMPNSPNLAPRANALNICTQMQVLAQHGTIDRVILAGDGNVWRHDFLTGQDIVQDLINQINCANSIFMDSRGFAGGMNVSLNPRRRMAFVNRCTGGNTGVFLLQQPYTGINGHTTRIL
ncbi:hypothetical protein [Agarilytica rhodophyticola]|uniref:hypothetical protein n=1 Tax=Agarilytica rhodophyticola TaxID=1737490 RepID=UPI000B344652|nr:hypothetical protein [Agarilytica rhodophyticola]